VNIPFRMLKASVRGAPLLIGAVAIGAVTSVLYAPCLTGGCAMVRTVVSTEISAPPELVAALYADWAEWPRLFPATIRGVRLLSDDGQRKTIEVDHATEGKVINIMMVVSPHEIRLDEFKHRFDARFINRFEAAGQGTRYSIVADVQLKGMVRALAPLAPPIVRARLKRFVLEPMRAAVENGLHGLHPPMVMQQKAGAVQMLYTERLSGYGAFISFFRSRDAIRALLERSGLLRPKLRVLDAGAGFGTATFALLDALRHRCIEPEAIEAFDLTPAMLARFQTELDSRGVTKVRLKQANVLELDQQLPSSWTNYDLIVSTSMLEYVPRPDLSQALSALGARLAQHGTLLAVITRKNWITRVLIEWWWQAARYSREELREGFATAGFRNLVFRRFPFRYCWQSLSNHVVMATRGETALDITRPAKALDTSGGRLPS
jgi:2-polyprenyl-3-methyl-5-hydroxy-6-metoxy-1,4-benzoquinol methylase